MGGLKILMNLKEWKEWAKGRTMAVVGIGVSNLPLIKFLRACNVDVIAYDKREPEALEDAYEELKAIGVEMILGENYLDAISEKAEVIFKTPGIRFDVPALKSAADKGAKISSEMELFFELCPAKKIAVTGSDGKTTTTSLIYDMLCRAGYNCYLGGNIGHPLVAELDEIKADDIVVLELSSFQLHTMKQSGDIAVVTNVTPNHLDWHTDFQEYIDSKRAIFEYQKNNGKLVLNYENDITRDFGKGREGVVYFSSKATLENGYCLKDNYIVYMENGVVSRQVLNINDIYIPGMHNVENYMTAIGAVDSLVDDDVIRTTAVDFKGVPHRIEFVREINGVKYYNDSIASSPARTTAGLKSFGGEKVILIAGGYDKKIPFDDFGEVINDYVKELVLVGLTSSKIEEATLNAKNYNGLKIHRCNEFKEAVEKAKEASKKGDIVILSPACASFDMFKNFEVRGNTYKDIVKSL